MPLTEKGKKIMKSMKKEYGKKKGEQVFYASKNKGKIKGVEKAYLGKAIKQPTETKKEFEMRHAYHKPFMKKPKGFRIGGVGGRAEEKGVERPGGGGGRNPMAQFEDKTKLTPGARQALTQQRQTARARISPSTTLKGQIIAQGIGAATGIPYYGGKIGSRIVDYTMGFSPMGKIKTNAKPTKEGEGSQRLIKPIVVETMKPVDPTLVNPKQDFFNFRAFKVGGLSGGVKYGPPPKRGPNPQVPPVKMKKGGYKK